MAFGQTLLACTFLDVGCGTDHFTRWFKEQGLQSIGLDFSRPMVVEASKLGSQIYLLSDALMLPFVSKPFDLVSLITTLEFLPVPIRTLSEALRVARLGIILGVLNAQSCLSWQYKHAGGPKRYKRDTGDIYG